ncbi:MAG: hypothetical protein ABIP55_11045, partial [Tepidisphaeraceae bacterium]
GSKLWIGGQQVVNNDGKHSAQERSGSIILDAGWHALKLGYFEASGGEQVSASFSGPGIAAKQLIPDAALQRADRAPTIATPASASPNPVSGNQTSLSVVGADESGEGILSYTWSATSLPNGAASPTFSVNGSNAAKNSSATFSKAGNYTLQVAISDGLMTTNTNVSVTVASTVTSITVSPASTSVKQNRTRQFSATAKDQFGNTISSPPAFTWATQANGGSITSGGLYTAPDAMGTYTVTASINGTSGNASVTVTEDFAPTVATPASANPSTLPAGTTSTSLSVLGADDGGESGLTYTWAATSLPQGAGTPTFSINGSNAARNATASALQAGAYTFTVTISDGFKTAISSMNVTVEAAQTGPTVATPASASPAPVTSNQTALSVLGSDDGGENALTYTWAITGTPPASVAFSANNSNAAKNSTATFTKAGTYNLQVTISDGSATTTSSVSVVVQQTLTSITLAPSSAIVQQGQTRQFTASALDQFGNALTSQPSFNWSVSSSGTGGTISSSGLYTAPISGTPQDTITASAGGKQGSATVTVTAPSQLDTFGQSADIGSPSLAGSYSIAGLSYSVKGSGADIWGTTDQFHYVYKTLSGDGQIIARVNAVQNTHARAKAGLMFRDTLAAGARHVNLIISPDKTTALQYRTTTNAGTASLGSAAGATAPYWLKLVRAGNTFTGYRSPDGVTWTLVATKSVTMGTTVYVGLSLTSHDNTKLNTSTFSNVAVQVAVPPAARSISTSAARSTPSSARLTGVMGGKVQASNLIDLSAELTDLYTINSVG